MKDQAAISKYRLFNPILAGASLRDRSIASIGAVMGVALAALAGIGAQHIFPGAVWLSASIGASAVLVFAIPASPMAQPWPVIGGNVISALVGVLLFKLFGSSVVVAAFAVGVAIIAMSLTRSLHPPGGGTALIGVIGGSAVGSLGFAFPLGIVLVNAITLVFAGWAFHKLTSHSYPHKVETAPKMPSGLLRADIDQAILDTGETFDINLADLEELLLRAEMIAEARQARR